MRKIQSHWRRYRLLHGILFGGAVALSAAWALTAAPGRDFDWPAWAQAVGSIAAILVAIWVSADQSEQQRQRDLARERDEVDGILRSIRSEVSTMIIYLGSQVAPVIRGARKTEAIRTTFSLPDLPFPIFDGLIPKIGMIPDRQLMNDIIHTYAYAKSLAMTAKVHNNLVEELAAAEARQWTIDLREQSLTRERDFAYMALLGYGEKLRDSFEIAYSELQHLADELHAACPDL